jgi:23S rRNA (uracil1939-C5)-methyltransferase
MAKRRFKRHRLPSEPVELKITSLSHEGRGVAHIDGKVAFVDGALAEETVIASYVRLRGQFDELKVEAIKIPAAARVTPKCQFAAQCGGCSLQHMDSSSQLELKQGVLMEQLQHVAKLSPESYQLLPKLQAGSFHYRRKARLAVRLVAKKGGALVGFREKYSSFITDMTDCQVLVQEVAELIQPLRDFISQLQARYTIPQVEVAVGEAKDGDSLRNQVALVFRHMEGLSDSDLEAFSSFARLYGVDLYLQPAGVNSVHKLYPTDALDRLQYFLPEFDLTMNFHPMDFTQVNADINRLIISRALQLLELQVHDVVLDLFCGLGNFTLPLATRCSQVVGVEGSAEMVQRGEENARFNRLSNARFFAANLCESLSDKQWAETQFTKVLLDPPRSGAIEIMAQIASFRAEKIVYISCNPAALVRDAVVLLENGYKLKSAGVMDMFPHTTHVESIAEFERVG